VVYTGKGYITKADGELDEVQIFQNIENAHHSPVQLVYFVTEGEVGD